MSKIKIIRSADLINFDTMSLLMAALHIKCNSKDKMKLLLEQARDEQLQNLVRHKDEVAKRWDEIRDSSLKDPMNEKELRECIATYEEWKQEALEAIDQVIDATKNACQICKDRVDRFNFD